MLRFDAGLTEFSALYAHTHYDYLPEGKAIASRNAYKGGLRAMLREVSALLREQRDSLRRV